eukprot:423124-Lingulodinium_polyedra.AAC.1
MGPGSASGTGPPPSSPLAPGRALRAGPGNSRAYCVERGRGSQVPVSSCSGVQPGSWLREGALWSTGRTWASWEP